MNEFAPFASNVEVRSTTPTEASNHMVEVRERRKTALLAGAASAGSALSGDFLGAALWGTLAASQVVHSSLLNRLVERSEMVGKAISPTDVSKSMIERRQKRFRAAIAATASVGFAITGNLFLSGVFGSLAVREMMQSHSLTKAIKGAKS
jgi:hypothetical protein